MVDKEYVKIFNGFWKGYCASKLFNSEQSCLFSMAKLGRLSNLKKGVSHPCYKGKKEVGREQIPDDIYNLLSVPDVDIQVWYLGADSSFGTGRDYAFKVQVVGYEEVSPIFILYGVSSGVQEIIVQGWWPCVCSVPDGFSLASFAEILNKGVLQDFVLANCSSLSESQRSHIIEHGLC